VVKLDTGLMAAAVSVADTSTHKHPRKFKAPAVILPAAAVGAVLAAVVSEAVQAAAVLVAVQAAYPNQAAMVGLAQLVQVLPVVLALYPEAVAGVLPMTAAAVTARPVAFVFGLGNGKQYEICNH
jgi:hypothetical protein